jgi:hypothetical protein
MKQANWNGKSILVPRDKKGLTTVTRNIFAKKEEKYD